MILQYLYKPVFNFIYDNLTCKIDKRIKHAVIYICFVSLMVMLIFNCSKFPFWNVRSFTDQSLIGCVVLFIIICMSIDSPLKILRYDKVTVATYILWYLCAVFILIASFHHTVGTGMRALALMMLVAFPSFYYVWNNRKDYEILFDLMAKAVVLAGCVYFIYCLICVPFSNDLAVSGRYYGGLKNPNFLGIICVAVFLCAAYLTSVSGTLKYLYMIACGAAIFFTALSGSRAAMLNIVLVFVICCIFILRKGLRKSTKTKERKQINGIMILVIMIVLCAAVFLISSMDGLNGVVGIFGRLKLNSTDLNSFSSGRIELWVHYAQELNLMGNHLVNGHKGPMGWTHINALEIGYRTGIINGIIYLVIEVIMGIHALVYIFSKSYVKKEFLFSALAIIVFCVYSVLDVAIFPFYTAVVLLFYIGIAPIFEGKTEKENELVGSGSGE